MWCEEKFCSIKNVTSAVSGEKFAAPGGSHLQYKKKVVQCEERVYSIRRATSAVGRQGVQFVEKVYSIRNVSSAI